MTTFDPSKLELLRRLKARGHTRPKDCSQEMWDAADSVEVKAPADRIQEHFENRIAEHADRALPADDKGMIRHLYPQAVAVHAEVMANKAEKTQDRLAAARFIAEHTIGKADQKVEHVGSLALDIHNSLDQLARGIRSGQIIDTENLLPKTDPAVDAFLKAHMPEKFIVGKKDVTPAKSEHQSSEGLCPGTGKFTKATSSN